MYVNPERKEEEKFIWKLFLSVMLLLGYNFKSNIKKKKSMILIISKQNKI